MHELRERMDDDEFEPEFHDAVLAALDQLSDIVTSQVGTRSERRNPGLRCLEASTLTSPWAKWKSGQTLGAESSSLTRS